MARKTPVSTACDENEDTVHKITPSMTEKRITLELSPDNEDDEIREINRNTSIADVSDSHDNLETTISELAVHSSSKKRHIILSSDSDSEDNEKECDGRTPGFNELKKCDAHATKVKRKLFRKNQEEGESNKVISERDSEGDGDSISMREIGGTSDNCNGAALISSSQNRRSTRSNSTCQNNGTVASAEKLKKRKALEELTQRRLSTKGACSRLSSNLADDDDNEGSLQKLEEDQAEEDQKEREEDENDLGSDSDLSDLTDVDSSQSQKLDDISFNKLSQEQCFEVYLQMILSGIVNDEFLSSLEKDKVPYFEEAKATIQGLIQTKKNAMMGKWKEFKEMLEDFTLIESIPLPEIIKNAKCEACNLNRHLSEIIVFYDEENGEKVTPPVKEFKVGRFCAERGHIYHELHHLDFEWKGECIKKISQVKASNPEVEDDAEIVERCMSEEEWLKDLYERFQSLFGVADDYGPGGKKRLAMKEYCSSFWED